MKAKSKISVKMFFRETLEGLCIEINNTMYIKELLQWLLQKNTRRVFQGLYQILNAHS